MHFFSLLKWISKCDSHVVGLEHGNFSAKDGEARRVWKNSENSYKELFRLLRFQSSPTLRRIGNEMKGKGRKTMRCSRCGGEGHKRTSRKCPLGALPGVMEPEVEAVVDIELVAVVEVEPFEQTIVDDDEDSIASADDSSDTDQEIIVTLDADNNIEGVLNYDNDCVIS